LFPAGDRGIRILRAWAEAMMVADARVRASALFRIGVAAADPAAAVHRALAGYARCAGRLLIVAVGKAARRMAAAALDRIGPADTIVATNDENAGPLPGAVVHATGHPVPDERGLAAAEAVIAAAAALGAEDALLALISGGGSALLPAPVAGVSLADKAAVNRLLLASGAPIEAMNLVRQNLSRLKGGGLARLAAPARVTALILSDVVGDDLRAIASGPTVAPLGDAAAARAVLRAHGIWEACPETVRRHLTHAPPAPPVPAADNRLIGSNALSVAAMAAAAPGARVPPGPLVGDVSAAAARIIAEGGPGVTLWGGETTVRLTGRGLGGRNQELALRVALAAEAAGWPPGWAFLSGGTDGRDGPTEAAGGLVDAGTLGRIRAAGLDPAALLADNDSHRALAAAGDLVITGGTGTNVADLQVLIRP
jgi:hydroxypyruvate reductase